MLSYNSVSKKFIINKKVLENFVEIKKFKYKSKISYGSFGSIFEIEFLFENIIVKCASKHINILSSSLNELDIMLNFENTFLNKAFKLMADKFGNFNIFQPIAKIDLAKHVRIDKFYLNENSLKKICFQIACGIGYLHHKGILHGDIKARNILYFDDYIKITDFGNSILFLKNIEKKLYDNNFYTATHRPIEVFKKENISFASDIWALGCTFYELAYNELLFNSQDTDEKYINKLNFWNSEKYMVHKKFFRDENFKNLLMGMLQLDKNKRITIWQILEHPYFSDLKNPEEYEYKYSELILNEKEFDESVHEKDVLDYAFFLKNKFSEKSKEIIDINNFIKISYKILYNFTPDMFLSVDNVFLKNELYILKVLNYNFYPN